MGEWSISIIIINYILNYLNKQQTMFGINDQDYINRLVEFEHVNFFYKLRNKDNIKDINFVAELKKITILVGYNGIGKTAIANLLLRKYKIGSGNDFRLS